jgi:hypothetical protein
LIQALLQVFLHGALEASTCKVLQASTEPPQARGALEASI